MDERRTNSRMLCSELVEVTWLDAQGSPSTTVANLEDISSTGICLQMDVSIPESAEITVRHRGGSLRGVVRYCEYREFGYFTGINFEGDSAWNERQFQPQHLVDPSRLASKTMGAGARAAKPAGGNAKGSPAPARVQ